MSKVILAVLQNMWVNDPERTKRLLARHPESRRRLIHFSLFRGCRTGQVLKKVFGEELCEKIVWEESTTQVAGRPSDVFPPDIDHLRAVLAEVKPDVVLAFGRVATGALLPLVPRSKLITGPHPTARQGDTHQRLKAMVTQLEAMTANSEGARG